MPSYKPFYPKIVDPAGVKASAYPRPMNYTTDESRAETVKQTLGEPLTDFEGATNPYIDYQSIDLLLSLQNPRSDAYDEMCFFVMGQVKEILFRGLHFELVNAQKQLRENEVNNALRILGRAKVFVEYIGDSWNVLSTIESEGFNQFRNHLGTASGQLSFMYRHVEFALGNKHKRLAAAHRNVPHVWPGIKAALESPSLYDEAIALIHREGHEVDAHALQRDWSLPYQENESVKSAWNSVYRQKDQFPDLYRLAEALVTIDEKMSIYRWRHFVSVQKIIGSKPGTGGSAGVGWLQAMTSHRFFPELWSIRSTW